MADGAHSIHKYKTIGKPGYHLKPKYDLVFLRKKRTGHAKKSVTADLPLVSMIDMFSILVLYLLMNFSATGEVFFIPKSVKLPEASHAHELKSAPLISILGDGITLETDKVGENPVTLSVNDENLPQLAAALKEMRKLEEDTKPGEKFKGLINIQADENTPLVYIKRVMKTCILEGWVAINFAVREVQ